MGYSVVETSARLHTTLITPSRHSAEIPRRIVDSRDEFTLRERFPKDAAGVCPVKRSVRGGDQDHREGTRSSQRCDFVANGDPVEPRQVHIEDDGIKVFPLEDRQRLEPVAGLAGLESCEAQVETHQATELAIV